LVPPMSPARIMNAKMTFRMRSNKADVQARLG
jgi:hypothetical protein